MTNDILSSGTVYPFLFIISSGYVMLLWGYRDAGLLDYFYDGLKEFDKAVQTTLAGVLIYFAGYYLSPQPFSGVFAQFPLTTPNFFAVAVIEILLVMFASSFAATVIRMAHSKLVEQPIGNPHRLQI